VKPHPDNVSPLTPEEAKHLPDDPSKAEMTPTKEAIIQALRSQPTCNIPECYLRDPLTRGLNAGNVAVEAFARLAGVAEMMYSHGDTIAAEAFACALNDVAEKVLRPYFTGLGINVDEED
jgi:hypothetical protein